VYPATSDPVPQFTDCAVEGALAAQATETPLQLQGSR
jgi:hypothetical protein